VDETLLVRETVACVVQVAGKKRAELAVAPDIGAAELEALALAEPAVVAALGGVAPRRVIARPPRIVNIVP
jgi:leucyl-tRNA synthetase